MDIPSSFYYLVGSLVVANVGTIGAIVVFAGRAIWWLSKLESRVDHNTKDLHAAHDKLREIKDDIKSLNKG